MGIACITHSSNEFCTDEIRERHRVTHGIRYETLCYLSEELLYSAGWPLRSQKCMPEGIKITRVLCSEAGSHDYAIYRSEARDELGLNIETPSMDLYTIIKDIHLDFRQELQLDSPYKPGIGPSIGHVQQDDLVRVIVESQKNGGYHFKSDIELVTAQNPQTTQPELKKTKHFDRWEFFDQ